MNDTTLDTITRQTATVSRRSTVMALGGALLAEAFTGTAAAKGGKKAGKKAGKQAKKTCKDQVQKCRNTITVGCADECGDDVLEAALVCCNQFAKCNAGAALECFFGLEAA
jgi:hypothetical protein